MQRKGSLRRSEMAKRQHLASELLITTAEVKTSIVSARRVHIALCAQCRRAAHQERLPHSCHHDGHAVRQEVPQERTA